LLKKSIIFNLLNPHMYGSLIYECGHFATVFLRVVCGAQCNCIRPAAGQPRREKREGKEYSINRRIANASCGLSRAGAAATVDASSLQRSRRHPCRRGTAQTAARYVKVGHPARRRVLYRAAAAGTATARGHHRCC